MKGVNLYNLNKIILPKGNVLHALKSTDEGFVGFGEAYFSQIESGAIKGWKRHNQFTMNLIVPVGKVKFIIYDDREESETNGCFEEYILSPDENYKRLTIEPGLWLAFKGLSDYTSILLDIIPEPHIKEEADSLELYSIKYDFTI